MAMTSKVNLRWPTLDLKQKVYHQFNKGTETSGSVSMMRPPLAADNPISTNTPILPCLMMYRQRRATGIGPKDSLWTHDGDTQRN